MLFWRSKSESGRKARHRRIRGKIRGTMERPRLFVFRSNKHIYAQLINDDEGRVIVSASDLGSAAKEKMKRAESVGRGIAEKAKSAKIERVVFDRGGYKYHGRVKALAEAARAGGLDF